MSFRYQCSKPLGSTDFEVSAVTWILVGQTILRKELSIFATWLACIPWVSMAPGGCKRMDGSSMYSQPFALRNRRSIK